MAIFSEHEREHVMETLGELERNVKLIFFTQDFECESCRQSHELLKELADLSDKLSLKVYDFKEDKEIVEKYRIDKIPALAVEGEKDYGIRYFGTPAGYEFAALLENILDVSRGTVELSEETTEELQEIDSLIHIQVFVTPTCPYCPRAVRTAHKLAQANDWIQADMVSATEFPHLANKYDVFSVPKVIINEGIEFEGALPERHFVQHILMAASSRT